MNTAIPFTIKNVKTAFPIAPPLDLHGLYSRVHGLLVPILISTDIRVCDCYPKSEYLRIYKPQIRAAEFLTSVAIDKFFDPILWHLLAIGIFGCATIFSEQN